MDEPWSEQRIRRELGLPLLRTPFYTTVSSLPLSGESRAPAEELVRTLLANRPRAWWSP